MKPIVLVAIVMAGVLSTTAAVVAQDDALTPEERLAEAGPGAIELTPEQDARARSLESEFKCPVCRSQSIRQSRSFMAEDMKLCWLERSGQGLEGVAFGHYALRSCALRRDSMMPSR